MDIGLLDEKLHKFVDDATECYADYLQGRITEGEYKRRKGIAVQVLAEAICDDMQVLIEEVKGAN